MRNALTSVLLLASISGLSGEALAADTAKLRYVTAIYLDEKGGGMRQPEGVACNDKSTVIVGDTGKGRLLRYVAEDNNVKPAGELQAPQLPAPIRIQINSKDEVFALDGKERRIGRFTATGEFKGYLSPDGVPASTSIVPRSFKIDRNDSIYILDVFSARVLVLDTEGKYLRHIEFPKDYGFFSDLAVDGKGAVYVLDSVKPAVYRAQKDAKEFSPLTKSLREHLSFPTSITVDSRGVLYIVDQNGGGVVLVGQDGSVLGRQLAMGRNEGLLYYPSQMCLNEKGQVFIADRGNSRVQVFSLVR
jgi:sugar lactone lactonase YvrE